MDPIVLAEKIFRIIRTRQTKLTEIIVNNKVKDWNNYQNLELTKKDISYHSKFTLQNQIRCFKSLRFFSFN